MHIKHIREAHFRSGVVCPRCQSKSTIRHGKVNDRQRYLCKSCNRTFTDLTDTPLSYVKKPANMWDEVARCMREGYSCRRIAEELNIAVSTAFRWRHKVLASLRTRTDLATVLSGIVEADETFFARSYKGSHFKNKTDPDARREEFFKAFGRYPRKHGKEVHTRGRSKEQVPVLVLRDRTARTVSLVMPSMKTEEISRQMLPVLSQDTVLCTDAYRGYKTVTKSAGIRHVGLNQSKGERTRGVYHIQNVNAYHKSSKGLDEPFSWRGTKYLENYMTWFAYLDTTRSIPPGIWEQRFLAMSCIDNKKIRNKSGAQTRTCVICNKPILTGQHVGSIFFVSHDTGEREPDQLCHSDCYHALGQRATAIA
ncbi:MAG: IS1595 family transposase [Alicyclobacillus sp.]|nr:IS1595 family transposase [Alicyclobacillus sp.]